MLSRKKNNTTLAFKNAFDKLSSCANVAEYSIELFVCGSETFHVGLFELSQFDELKQKG